MEKEIAELEAVIKDSESKPNLSDDNLQILKMLKLALNLMKVLQEKIN